MLFGLGAQHERIAPAREQLFDKCVGASRSTRAMLQFADRIFVRVFPLLAVAFTDRSNRRNGISIFASLWAAARCFVGRAVPGAAQQETKEHSADPEQDGVVPQETAKKDRTHDPDDRPS
jgi:hypothetical protein